MLCVCVRACVCVCISNSVSSGDKIRLDFHNWHVLHDCACLCVLSLFACTLNSSRSHNARWLLIVIQSRLRKTPSSEPELGNILIRMSKHDIFELTVALADPGIQPRAHMASASLYGGGSVSPLRSRGTAPGQGFRVIKSTWSWRNFMISYINFLTKSWHKLMYNLVWKMAVPSLPGKRGSPPFPFLPTSHHTFPASPCSFLSLALPLWNPSPPF